MAIDAAGAAVVPLEHRPFGAVVLGHPGGREDRADLAGVELLVLRREGVDRGPDDLDAVAVEALPHERLAPEHVRRGWPDVRLREVPRGAIALVREIESDVWAPDDVSFHVRQRLLETVGLRVVGDHDVA